MPPSLLLLFTSGFVLYHIFDLHGFDSAPDEDEIPLVFRKKFSLEKLNDPNDSADLQIECNHSFSRRRKQSPTRGNPTQLLIVLAILILNGWNISRIAVEQRELCDFHDCDNESFRTNRTCARRSRLENANNTQLELELQPFQQSPNAINF